MFEAGSQESMGIDQEIIGSQEISASDTVKTKKDQLLFAILGTAIFLAFLVWGTAVIWGTGPVLIAAPWYIPLISFFISLITLLIGYMALGRYQVLRDPVSFWVGSGFAVYGLGQVFYALTWPGLLPDGSPIIGHLASTSAWIALIDLTILEVFLLAAVLNPWPNRLSLPGNQWRKLVFIYLGIAAVVFSLLILLERVLPVLVDGEAKFHTATADLARRPTVFFCAEQHLFHSVLPAIKG